MRQKKEHLFRTVKAAAALIRSSRPDRFRFADDGIIDPRGEIQDRSNADRMVQFGRVGESLYRIGNRRRFIPIGEIPAHVRSAFIVYEDARFYRHKGYDLRGILRALANNLTGRRRQGASTITMQLARMLFLYHYRRQLRYKLAQLYLALLLERHFSKDEILELYLNSLFFANRIYGIEAAARFYLNKSARDLSLSECLYLGAVSQRPTLLNPLKAPEKAEHFRQQRLAYFLRIGEITQKQYHESLKDVPVLCSPKRPDSAVPARFEEVYTVRFDRETGQLGENAQAVYRRLREAGFTLPVIAGIMGNLQVESCFRPDAGISFGDPGAVGLVQWAGHRMENLKKAWPEGWQTLDRQMDFLFSEFGVGHTNYEDPRAARFFTLALADGQRTPEYYADLFQALVEQNINAETWMEEISTNTAAGRMTFRGRLPRTPNQYNGRYYLDADRRRNYAKVYAFCLESMAERSSGHDGK